ncbi:hypothetical protein, partial [Streptomyces brasiliscabiei]|uniref:hypothetical protein n=1 Tax=Streptomyces brasiliscabiei TaxID=2736302 RepID=UPI0030149D77
MPLGDVSYDKEDTHWPPRFADMSEEALGIHRRITWVETTVVVLFTTFIFFPIWWAVERPGLLAALGRS